MRFGYKPNVSRSRSPHLLVRTPPSSRGQHRLHARSNRHLTANQPASRGKRRIPPQAKLLAVHRSHHLQTELAVAPRVDVRAAELHIALDVSGDPANSQIAVHT